MRKVFGLTDTLRSNGHIILSYDWRVCAGIPNVGSGLVDSSVPNPQPSRDSSGLVGVFKRLRNTGPRVYCCKSKVSHPEGFVYL